jgi:hypothetical protein
VAVRHDTDALRGRYIKIFLWAQVFVIPNNYSR